jgi:arylsulfatase A-like enzyme
MPNLSTVLQRWATALVFALGAAALAAVIEISWAVGAATQALNVVRGWLAVFALIVPFALPLAMVVAVVAPVVDRQWGAAVSEAGGPGEGRGLVRTLPAVGFALALSSALVAHLSLSLMRLELSTLSVALLLSLGAVAVTRAVLGIALRFGHLLLPTALSPWLSPARALLLAGVLLVGPVVYGVAAGSTNGDGGFWAVFGVLSRQELDLRPSLAVLGIALAAHWGQRIARLSWFAGLVGLLAALAALTVTAARLLDDLPLSLAIERGGALGRTGLVLLRRASDSDGDGVSHLFGGNDCDDLRDDVYPGAVDVPGNGVDEDCSGGDARAAAPRPSPPPPQAPKSARDWIAERLPANLNVILLTVDTLRFDLGFTGYSRPTSPNIDRLAARSVIFERGYSLASYTGKIIGPMQIGRYPSETHRGWWHFNKFGEDETFVQERMQAAGIRTLSVQGHWYFTPQYGIGRGFDVLDLSAKPHKRQGDGDKTVNSDKLSDAAIAQLSVPDNTRERFFMWVHYLDPHAEYMRHPEFNFGRRGRDLYDSEVAYTDQQIGRLLDFVAASEFADRTAIVVTSDHGEAFGEHGMYRHGFELWEALVRVPLVVFVPGAAPQRHSVRRGAIDLAPTLLELFGLPLPEGEQRLSGRSLLEDIYMPPGYEPEARPIFVDMSAGPYNEERQALIQDDVKLITGAGRMLGLYDLGQDPEEKHDRIGDTALLKRMKGHFETFREGLRLVQVKPR